MQPNLQRFRYGPGPGSISALDIRRDTRGSGRRGVLDALKAVGHSPVQLIAHIVLRLLARGTVHDLGPISFLEDFRVTRRNV
jgi:hypothetical protein